MRVEIRAAPPPDEPANLPYMEAHKIDPSTGEDELALARAGAETKTANAAATKPSSSKQDAEPEKNAGNAPGVLNGAAPTVSSNAFDNRFGAWN